MSRIGKLPIEIPQGVKVELEGRLVKLSYKHRSQINVVTEGEKVLVSVKKETKTTAGYYGLTRTLIANMIKGVTDGFEKKLEFHGVGYRAAVEGGNLVLHLGYSHPITYTPREGIEIKVEKNELFPKTHSIPLIHDL